MPKKKKNSQKEKISQKDEIKIIGDKPEKEFEDKEELQEEKAEKEEQKDEIQFGKKLKITALVALVILASAFLLQMHDFLINFYDYFKIIWWAILLGLFIGGLIDYFIPEEFIFNYLGQKKIRSIFFAVIAGFLMSACSHGILAISMQLYKKGASIPAVITFLLASPWANLPVTILMFSFFGIKALLFISAAIIVAVITGFIFMGLEKAGLIEKSKRGKLKAKYDWNNIKNFNLKRSLKGVMKGSVNLANMVLWWIIIGFLIAVAIRTFVPAHIFLDYFGASITGLLLTLVFATIIEVCSEGSAPIAFEIFHKVGTLGNPFVFLMAGVVTDYTEIGLIWSNIGKRTAIWLPIVTVPQVLLIAIFFNTL